FRGSDTSRAAARRLRSWWKWLRGLFSDLSISSGRHRRRPFVAQKYCAWRRAILRLLTAREGLLYLRQRLRLRTPMKSIRKPVLVLCSALLLGAASLGCSSSNSMLLEGGLFGSEYKPKTGTNEFRDDKFSLVLDELHNGGMGTD